MEAETALLQLCVGSATERLAAWPHWVAALSPPTAGAEPYPARWRDLLPLVAYRQREHALPAPDWLLSRLRTSALTEEHRLAAVENTTAEILADPVIAGLDPLLLGGLALGQTVYPAPATRHTGIITLLLRPGTRLRPLMHALVAQGYVTREGGWRTLHLPFARHARLRLSHPSQMRLLLLSAPAWRRSDPLGHSALTARGVVMTAGNARFTAPALPDALSLTERRLTGESLTNLVPSVDEALLRQALAKPVPTKE